MADRSVAATSTMNDLRREFNGSARDVGDISDLLGIVVLLLLRQMLSKQFLLSTQR